eukprot:757269-Hanusia_phi.AAC.13
MICKMSTFFYLVILWTLVSQTYSFTPFVVELNLGRREGRSCDHRSVKVSARVLPKEDKVQVDDDNQLNSEVPAPNEEAPRDIQASSQIMKWLGSQYATKRTTKQYLESVQTDIELQESRIRRPDDFGDELGESSDESPTFKMMGKSNLKLSKRKRFKMAVKNSMIFFSNSARSMLKLNK